MIFFNSINFVTFISFLSFLFQEFFIMSKCCLNHFSLTQFILAEDVQMSSLYDCCARQKKFCIIFNKFNKCSKYVHSKKSCLLFSSFLTVNIIWLLKIHEKIEKKQITFFNEKQCLFEVSQAAEIKKYQLCHHAQFLYNHDNKLIQEPDHSYRTPVSLWDVLAYSDNPRLINYTTINSLIKK